MSRDFFSEVYSVGSAEQKQKLYSDWADSYDSDLQINGYRTPKRCAEAAASVATDLAAPVLDVGCGTGLSGLALRTAGFTNISGTDVNADMLRVAEARGIYRTLWKSDPGVPFSFETGTYSVISAIGVIGRGAAPIQLLHDCLAKLDSRGLMTFSFNDHTLAEPAYEDAVKRLENSGEWEIPFRQYGPHLTELGMNANVYVLRKL